MRIEKHIKDLLYRYECVIIPGFGAFIAQRKPAEIHESTKAFYPPKKVISFNRQLTEDDGILANYISKAENISYKEALFQLTDFADELRSSLENHREIALDEIGVFYKAEEKILFQPSSKNNFLTEAFGTSSFVKQKVEREKKQTPKENLNPPLSVSETRETSTKRKPAYWKYAAVGVVAIGMAGFLGTNWYSQEVKEHNLAEQQKAATKVDQQIQQATFMIDEPLPEITFKVKKISGKYHIVAGAFRLEENADKKVEQLKTEGFSARKIGTNTYGLHEVVYTSLEDRLEALKALRKIKNTNNPDAWLLVKEL